MSAHIGKDWTRRDCWLLIGLISWLIISIARWDLISSTGISFLFTPWVLSNEPSTWQQFVRLEFIEYWAALVVWLALLGMMVRSLMVKFREESATSSLKTKDPNPRSRLDHYGVKFLIGCTVLVFLTPFLAPLDPTAQGDLRSMRLLSPFSLVSVETSESKEIKNEESPDDSWAVQTLIGAHRRLEDSKRLPRSGKGMIGEERSNIQQRSIIFLLGTDGLARDVLSRLLHGLRLSLFIGTLAVIATIVAGSLIGFVAGIAGGWIDHMLMRLTDLFLSVPSLFLVIMLVALLGSSLVLLITVLACTGWMSVARVVRGEVLSLREREFILVARLLGRSAPQIVRDHLVPNVLPTIIVASILQLSNVMLAEAALGFLGIGIQPPTPSLGNMVGEAIPFIGSGWWIGLFPGMALSLVVILANRVGEKIQASFGAAQ